MKSASDPFRFRAAASSAALAVVLAPVISVQAMPAARIAALRVVPTPVRTPVPTPKCAKPANGIPKQAPESQSPVWVVATIAAPSGKAGAGDSNSAVTWTDSDSDVLSPHAGQFAKLHSIELHYSPPFERTYLATAPPAQL